MTPKEVSNELRKVAEKHKGLPVDTFQICISDMATDAANAIDELQVFVDKISSLSNCNDCWRQPCEFKPRWGEQMRYNCPAHVTGGVDITDSYWLTANPYLGRELTKIDMTKPTPSPSSYDQYLSEFALNHNISLDLAVCHPMVMARLDYYNKTGR